MSRPPAQPVPRIRWRDDQGSLVMALLVAFIGIAMVTMLLPVMLTQRGATSIDDQHAGALSAAQGGLDATFGQINASADVVAGTRVGNPGKLPCGPVTGTVSSAGTGLDGTYRVLVDYFTADPTGLYYDSSTHTYDNTAIAHASTHISCVAGSGTGTVIPSYALLRSQGAQSSTAPARMLVATYKFRLGNANVPGGLIHVFQVSGSQDLCIDAGSSPSPGTRVQMRPCSAGSVQQQFAYSQTLTLVLTSSRSTTYPNGLCLDAGPVPHTTGTSVVLQQCAATTQPRQQWSYNGKANFEGTADGQTSDGYCFNVQSPNVSGSYLVLGSTGTSTCGQPYDDVESFSPDASVGAGMASAGTGQLVNYQQFGRCLDVTQGHPTATFLIAWPCKQSPDPSKLSWNELWDLPAFSSPTSAQPGHVTTTDSKDSPTTAYCLDSPLSTASGMYVTVTACSGAPAANTSWRVYGDTGTFATSYVIKDSAGYCLAPSTTDFFVNGSSNVSKIVMAVCDGSALQKWNAPADVTSTLTNIGER